MADEPKRSKKRAAVARDPDPTEGSDQSTPKKQKVVSAASVKSTTANDSHPRLKNVPKFLHSKHSNQYFSKPWWKEMLLKDEFWTMLQSNLTQTIRNKRLRIEFDTGHVSRQAQLAKAQVELQPAAKLTPTSKKVHKKQAAPSADPEPVPADVQVCGACNNHISAGDQFHKGDQDNKICQTCSAAADDNEPRISKVESPDKHSEATVMQGTLSKPAPGGRHAKTPTTPHTPASDKEHDPKLLKDTVKNDEEDEISDKEEIDVKAVLKAWISKPQIKNEYITIE